MPKLTVITRKAYGGAYDVMGSKHVGADFNFAWPTAEIAVMGAEGAVNIVFRKELETADDPTRGAPSWSRSTGERFANPFIAAERGYVDDVIEPRGTRPALIAALEACRTKRAAAASASTGTSRCEAWRLTIRGRPGEREAASARRRASAAPRPSRPRRWCAR